MVEKLLDRSLFPFSYRDGFAAFLDDSAILRILFFLVLTSSACGQYGSNRVVLKSLVREQFRRNMHETDPEKIEAQKEL